MHSRKIRGNVTEIKGAHIKISILRLDLNLLYLREKFIFQQYFEEKKNPRALQMARSCCFIGLYAACCYWGTWWKFKWMEKLGCVSIYYAFYGFENFILKLLQEKLIVNVLKLSCRTWKSFSIEQVISISSNKSN